jgi:hypothetical protein
MSCAFLAKGNSWIDRPRGEAAGPERPSASPARRAGLKIIGVPRLRRGTPIKRPRSSILAGGGAEPSSSLEPQRQE